MQFKELKYKDEELLDRKKELSQANSLHTNICDEIKDNQKVLDDINSKISEAKIASSKAIKRAETDKDKTNSLLEENSDKRDVANKKLEGLNQEVDIIRKEIEEGTEKVDKDLEYNKKWQAFLRSKERDLRLWEVRVARKLKKEFPNVTLQFKEFDDKEKTKKIKI